MEQIDGNLPSEEDGEKGKGDLKTCFKIVHFGCFYRLLNFRIRGSSVFQGLGCWLEGCELKPQQYQATTAGPLSKACNLQLPQKLKKKTSKNDYMSNKVCDKKPREKPRKCRILISLSVILTTAGTEWCDQNIFLGQEHLQHVGLKKKVLHTMTGIPTHCMWWNIDALGLLILMKHHTHSITVCRL